MILREEPARVSADPTGRDLRLRNAHSHSRESTLGEVFSSFSSFVHFTYPILCFFFALGFLLNGRIAPALWFGLSLAISFILQRKLGELD